MKVTAFVGSARKKHTFNAAERFLQNLRSLGNVETELVQLSEYELGICRGCLLCLNKGEELCPLKDDRDLLIRKITDSDGVVFATPNYSFHVSALMKSFLDRFGYLFHRPRFFGKTSTSIVVQGIYGGGTIVKYFNFIGYALGFNVVKGCCVTTMEPIPEKRRAAIERTIDGLSRRFYSQLIKKEFKTPSLLDLLLFRMGRSSRKIMLDESMRDYNYMKEQGWFESEYYYPVQLGLLKKIMGRLFDQIAVRLALGNNK